MTSVPMISASDRRHGAGKDIFKFEVLLPKNFMRLQIPYLLQQPSFAGAKQRSPHARIQAADQEKGKLPSAGRFQLLCVSFRHNRMIYSS